MLVFLSGLFPHRNVLRLQPLSGKILHKLGLELSEHIIVSMIISFRESDVVSHKEHLRAEAYRGFDIREKGSKNAGASNALILFGKVLGIGCALFDIAKATFAILKWRMCPLG